MPSLHGEHLYVSLHLTLITNVLQYTIIILISPNGGIETQTS